MRRLLGLNRIDAYVAGTALAATVGLALSWQLRGEFLGTWALVAFIGIGILLEVSATTVRDASTGGSLAFLVHLPAFVLFGPFWSAVVAGTSTLASELVFGKPANKVAFNAAQKVVAVLAAAVVYWLVGAHQRPDLILPGVATTFQSAAHTLVAFLAGSAAYFLTNSVLVCNAIAISTGRSFITVWRSTSLYLLAYDIVASGLALVVAWLFLVLDDPSGLRRFIFLAAFAPLIAIKHVYNKLGSLQKLYDELDSAHARLESNVREQLAMMVKSIEARDPYTSGHSMRVAAVSKAIAIDFGLSDELIAEVENAALLHDVGKIHAEFAPLLQKEGKLTPEEWDIMKTHAAKSADLVGLFARFNGHVQDSVRHHHERWDGLGYPAGVAAEAIPLGARIIMVADTIDAMTTDRPYRKALGFESVVSELAKHRGTQFDPRLVDCVMNSVTIRRMIAEPNLGVSAGDPGLQIVQSAPLRSYDSFFLGRRRS